MPTTSPAGSHHHAFQQHHICVVTDTYPPEVNGVALTLARLVDGLKVCGHAVSVVCPRQWSADGTGCGSDPKLTLVRGVPLPGYKGLHVGLPAGGVAARMLAAAPARCGVRGHGGPSRMVGSAHRPAFRNTGLEWLSYQLSQLLEALQGGLVATFGRALYLRWFRNRTTGTLVPSIDLWNQLHACGFKNVSVLGRGVDSQLFTPARRCGALRETWGVSEHDLVVFYVGRVAAEKNLGLAIAALRRRTKVAEE